MKPRRPGESDPRQQGEPSRQPFQRPDVHWCAPLRSHHPHPHRYVPVQMHTWKEEPMGVMQRFERKLQGAVAGTFARLFGGSVHPAEVADALQTEAAAHLQHQAGRTIAPHRYLVRLGPTDHDGVGQDEERVASALSTMIREYLDEQGWQTFG